MWLSFKTYSVCIVDGIYKRLSGQKEEVEISQVVQQCSSWMLHLKNTAESSNWDNLFHWFEEMMLPHVKVMDSHQPIGKQPDTIFWLYMLIKTEHIRPKKGEN